MKNACFRVFVSVVAITGVAAGREARQGQPQGSGTVIQVHRNGPNGSYLIRYRVGDVDREYVFEPATLIAPAVTTEVTLDGQASRFTYRYRVANHENAVQQMHSISISAITPSRVAGTPPGWEELPLSKIGRIAWYMKPVGEAKLGIPAGAFQDGFVIESESLPGPAEARCAGNAPFPTVTPDIPDEVKNRISELVRTNYLVVNVLAPVIASGLNEPELDAATFLSRIRAAYEAGLIRSKHRHAAEINAALGRVVVAAQSATPDRRPTELEAVQVLLRDAGEDEWSKTVSDGLSLALSYAGKRYRW
jgi:hypothetical protein